MTIDGFDGLPVHRYDCGQDQPVVSGWSSPYDVRGGVRQLVQTVLQVLRGHITAGEWADVRRNMPKELAAILA